MYSVIKDVIESGNYQLVDISNKINKLWLEYQLTDEERDELLELANKNINIDNEKPALEKRIVAVRDYAKTLEFRIKALEEGQEIEPPVEEYQAWITYDDVVNLGYDYGDKVTHNGFKWENMLQGIKNIWEPGADGIDERYWKKLKNKINEGEENEKNENF